MNPNDTRQLWVHLQETYVPEAKYFVPPRPFMAAYCVIVNKYILVVFCSLFNPTHSLSSMIVNKYKLTGNIWCFNLGGMGCSSDVIAIDLANDMSGSP